MIDMNLYFKHPVQCSHPSLSSFADPPGRRPDPGGGRAVPTAVRPGDLELRVAAAPGGAHGRHVEGEEQARHPPRCHRAQVGSG